MRKLPAVISQMLKVIPADEKGLRSRLRALSATCSYAAPEMMKYKWVECANILSQEIPHPKEVWEKRVEAIFSDRPTSAE